MVEDRFDVLWTGAEGGTTTREREGAGATRLAADIRRSGVSGVSGVNGACGVSGVGGVGGVSGGKWRRWRR